VSVVIAIAEKQPKSAEKIDVDAVAVYRHNLGRLEIGKHYGADRLAGTAAAQTISGSPGPMISALVTESENPSIALRALETARLRVEQVRPLQGLQTSHHRRPDGGERVAVTPKRRPDGGNPEGEREDG